MDRHLITYEQYCWVKNKNVVFQETVFHDGSKSTSCLFYPECAECGGCKNTTLKRKIYHVNDKKRNEFK